MVAAFRFDRLWQIIRAGICYLVFGFGVLIVGIFFRLLAPLPFIPATTRQRWIRGCIQKGCLSFIILMRCFGLIRYSFSSNMGLSGGAGHVVIANHPSLIDVVLLLAVNKQVCCIVKSSIWENFFTGAVVRQAGFISNNAEYFLASATAKLKAGENILIFPEGTRTKSDNVLRFKRGAANIAISAGAPIRPVLIDCYPSALKKGDKWYDIPRGGPAFVIKFGPLIQSENCIDTLQPKPRQYRQLTQYLEAYYAHWHESEGLLSSHTDKVAEKL